MAPNKVLPNIPGAVNNFLAGRSYPMEGTAMLMPQIAPYSDPLTILVCGGSTPYQGVALDNCVSIAPEAANPTWTLERMVRFRSLTSTAQADFSAAVQTGYPVHGRLARWYIPDPQRRTPRFRRLRPRNGP